MTIPRTVAAIAGAALVAMTVAAIAIGIAADAAMVILLILALAVAIYAVIAHFTDMKEPLVTTPHNGLPPYPVQQAQYPVMMAPTNELATPAMVLGIVGLFVWITGPVALIMGHVSMRQIDRTGEQGRGQALAGAILGWIVTIVLGLFVFIGLMAMAGLAQP